MSNRKKMSLYEFIKDLAERDHIYCPTCAYHHMTCWCEPTLYGGSQSAKVLCRDTGTCLEVKNLTTFWKELDAEN